MTSDDQYFFVIFLSRLFCCQSVCLSVRCTLLYVVRSTCSASRIDIYSRTMIHSSRHGNEPGTDVTVRTTYIYCIYNDSTTRYCCIKYWYVHTQRILVVVVVIIHTGLRSVVQSMCRYVCTSVYDWVFLSRNSASSSAAIIHNKTSNRNGSRSAKDPHFLFIFTLGGHLIILVYYIMHHHSSLRPTSRGDPSDPLELNPLYFLYPAATKQTTTGRLDFVRHHLYVLLFLC